MAENTKTIYQIYLHQTRVNPDAVAFIEDREFSFAEFLTMVDSLAAGFVEKGIKKGDRICTMALNSVAHFSILVACSKIGAIAFPINWRFTPEEVKKSLELVEPKMFIAEKRFLDLVSGIDQKLLGECVLIGEGSEKGYIAFADLRSTKFESAVDLKTEDPTIIISTAAVAGTPRGGLLSTGNIEAATDLMDELFPLTNQDRYLSNLPFFHITGILFMFGIASIGGACVISPKFEPGLEAKWIDEHKISMICTFPPMLEGLIAAKKELGCSWDSLKWCLGILNPPEVIEDYLKLGKGEYWTAYGQTETTGAITLFNIQEKPGSIGKPISSHEFRLVDEDNNDVSLGEVGEIVIKGPMVFLGYYNDEPATQFTFRYGWHHTGDMASMDEEGYLYYAGRKPEKDLIKSGGENIYPAEVEKALRAIPQIAEACVFGIQDDEWGETVKAVIELKLDGSMTEDDILAKLEGSIASYKKPRHIEFIDLMPRMGTGHIDREEIKKKYS